MMKLNTLMTFFAVVSIGLMSAVSAQAIYVDFADYQGQQSGSSAKINAGGNWISISSKPGKYDLNITNAGLGVSCKGGRWKCAGNSKWQIDSEAHEAIKITFLDGPVSVKGVYLSYLYRGEKAVISGDNMHKVVAVGTSYRNGKKKVSMDADYVTELTFRARGWHSDYAIKGIHFNSDKPVTTIPEPHAALLFVAGIGVVAARRRR